VTVAPNQSLMAKSYYSASVAEFLTCPPDEILGRLAASSDFDIDQTQRNAWMVEVETLREALPGVEGTLHFEFVIPRIGTRADVILLSGPTIFVLEFKVGESTYNLADFNQVWDYALDLKNFHAGSHDAEVIPILIATEAKACETQLRPPAHDRVVRPARANRQGLRKLIDLGLRRATGTPIDPVGWLAAPYRPTPTIVEAARALYAGHTVEAIARHEAEVRNLTGTTHCIEQVMEEARASRRKAIVFVTGVPGAGKTLVGLNIATKRRDDTQSTHAVFLSGNGPLVAVLREALTRDDFDRRRLQEPALRKGDVARAVKVFIQNVHHFRDDGLNNPDAPHDHVVIFDEAQRAWNREMTVNFMRRRKKRLDFTQSEPEFLISCLDRHEDWAVVICLVGGGQEINRGEAGISAWLEAIRDRFPHWQVYISPELTDSEYAAGHAIETLGGRAELRAEPDLHLAVSMRSFRSEKVSAFVKALLDCDRDRARYNLDAILPRFPIRLTRDLVAAKRWIREMARGSERFGMVASSGGYRLKPHAIDVRVDVDPVHWFLAEAADTRSSCFLEDAATEFDVQGLELDWVCVNWDADLRFDGDKWQFNRFVGTRWNRLHQDERKQRLLNAYRVLLTRARQGMVLFVPPGEEGDSTRNPAHYDYTFEYLHKLGIPLLESA
jgi:hypothetical protein